ncbi:hypothetical protein Tco_1032932 [Tanacetum coccineum]|uniref:Uncharacterized protein n=1 Tax=Tanacetum coccineum TaxID=301880 RepID=A0ABQ5GEM2_9ASTR
MASTQASSSNPSKKIKLTIIPPGKLFVDLTQDNDDATTPSPITKSSSLSPPNAPSKNPSTKDTSSTFDAPLRPLNLIPLQSHPSLDITLSLSPITLIDHLFESLSPPSPPTPPQPPIMDSARTRLQHRSLHLHLNVSNKKQIWTNMALHLSRFGCNNLRFREDRPVIRMSQSRQHDKSESDSYYLSD